MPLPEDVHVQMRHTFSRVRAAVYDDTKAAFQIELFCNLGRRQQQISQQLAITGLGIEQARQYALWNYQNVDRRLRIDIAKSNKVFLFQNNFGGNLVRDDFFEDGHG